VSRVIPLSGGYGWDTAIGEIEGIEQILRNAAARSAHEVARMLEEIPGIESYARRVFTAVPDDDLATALRHVEGAAEGVHRPPSPAARPSSSRRASGSSARGSRARRRSWPDGARPGDERRPAAEPVR
jgi:hypothetical protein